MSASLKGIFQKKISNISLPGAIAMNQDRLLYSAVNSPLRLFHTKHSSELFTITKKKKKKIRNLYCPMLFL